MKLNNISIWWNFTAKLENLNWKNGFTWAAKIVLLLWRTRMHRLHCYISLYNSQFHIEWISPDSAKPASRHGAPQTAKCLLWPSQLYFDLSSSRNQQAFLLNVDWLAALRRLPEWSTGGVYGENRPLLCSISHQLHHPICTHTHAHFNTERQKQTLGMFLSFDTQRHSDQVNINWIMQIWRKIR